MKRSKIFMAVGAFLLTVVGVATTKAHSNKKFTAAKATYISGGATFTLFTGAGITSNLTAGVGNNKTAKVQTSAAGFRTLLTANAGMSNKLHYIH